MILKPKFSIIIPVYNVAPYLRECLDSVLVQTFSDWEAICVDDGSTDESGAILDEYAAKDKRFRVFHKENGGVSSARNLALDNAKGEWIGFLDGDDVWNNEMLGHVIEIIKNEKPELVRVKFNKFRLLDFTKAEELSDEYKCVTEKGEINRFVDSELVENGYVWLLFGLRVLINGIRFPIGVKYAEDVLFVLKVFSQITKFVQSQFSGYYYRIRDNSAVKQLFDSDERLRFLNEFETVSKLYPSYSKISWMAWFAVLNWILRPQDIKKSKEIHVVFKSLCNNGIVKLSFLKFYERISVFFYNIFGWIWPTKCIYGLIKWIRR